MQSNFYNQDDNTFNIEAPMDDDLFFYFKKRGFHFPREVLSSYFLSLKAKPFVILTGISGTGKTKIAQIFADYICQIFKEDKTLDEEKTKKAREKRIAFVPVRPDWMDNRGLLGFYNLISGKYVVAPVLRLLLRAKEDPANPYFVILDEMNIAKVEYYFSDFLSIMESRTHDRPEGEALILHDQSEDIDASDGGDPIPEKLHIPPNVFFTGTVNVDETTYMFSPKVLDRANVIEFNEVDLRNYLKPNGETESFRIGEGNVLQHLSGGVSKAFCTQKDFADPKGGFPLIRNQLVDLHEKLQPYNLHFGYRVVNEMSRFVWLSKDFLGDKFDLEEAFDIQILQKILPKFHGTQGKLEQPLRDLLSFCYGQAVPGENLSDEMIQKADGFDEEAVYPRSAKKIAQMLKNLQTQGYTSFIE